MTSHIFSHLLRQPVGGWWFSLFTHQATISCYFALSCLDRLVINRKWVQEELWQTCITWPSTGREYLKDFSPL